MRRSWGFLYSECQDEGDDGKQGKGSGGRVLYARKGKVKKSYCGGGVGSRQGYGKGEK